MERLQRWALATLSMVAVAGLVSLGAAAEPTVLAALPPAVSAGGYAGGGEETCIECHDEGEEFPVLSILKTAHAATADRRTPFASDITCQSCHGPSAGHVEDSDELPGVSFGPEAPAEPQNAACLECHQRSVGMHWVGGAHDSEGLTCAGCHTIHVGEDAGGDPILSKNVGRRRGPNSQAEVCFGCHPRQRAMSYRISAHPIRYGQMSCTDCHSPHGSAGPRQLVKPTLNETCYRCHAEKRGPFLWEHAPAREDCSNCHTVHGSNHPPLLRSRAVWLCKQCHMTDYHPSTAYTGVGTVVGGDPDYHLLAKGCLNCHSEVHGSNHPSGVRWTR